MRGFGWLVASLRWFIGLFHRTKSQPTSGWGRRTRGNARLTHFFAIIAGEAKPKCGRIKSFSAEELEFAEDSNSQRCPRCA